MATGVREEARRARNEVYRQAIQDAAEAVFAAHGFEATKVQQIAERAGLSMGTIYSIFPGKQELYEAILAQHGAELLRLVGTVHEGAGSPLDMLDDLVVVYIDYFAAHPEFLRMHLRSGTSWALGPALGTATQRRYWQEIHALQADVFRRGVEAEIFVDEDPDFLAKLFSVIDQVLLADWVARDMPDERDALLARLRAQVRQSFTRR